MIASFYPIDPFRNLLRPFLRPVPRETNRRGRCTDCGTSFRYYAEPDEDPVDMCRSCCADNLTYATAMMDSHCKDCKQPTGYCECEFPLTVVDRPAREVELDWVSGKQIGDPVVVWVAAPGTGCTVYEVVRVDERGVAWGEIVASTAHELSPSEVI